jgi:3-hydroxyacyl-CoA dehydrogenase
MSIAVEDLRMNPSASYGRHGAVTVITLDNPPVNGISHALRSRVLALLDEALADAQVRAIVLTGGEKLFSGGADVREFGTAKSGQQPNLPALIAALESSDKPVVAAIAGSCLGGGLELALGCHFRIAKADASLGLPEVKLGLLPGAGGTQRLPRAIGLEAALNMILSGEPQPAARFEGTGLLDAVVKKGDLIAAAVAFAERVAAEGRPLKRLRDVKLQQPNAEAFLQFARSQVKAMNRFLPAPLKCVEAVAASASLPFDAGLRLERELFQGLMNTPESRALRHVFAAERAASKVDVPADTPLREVRKVGIVGAGTMGGGIAMAFANAGFPVALLEASQAALDKGYETLRANYEASLKKGKLTQAQFEQRLALITPTLSYDSFRDADLAIEAVFESLEVKEQVFRALDEVMQPGAILASNTSALDLDAIARFTRRPQDVIGLHFFSPANVMRLLEVVRGAATAPDVLATTMALAKRIKKVAVVSGVCDGFIGNRILARYGAAANDLLDHGALPQQVDRALEDFGFAMGLFRVGDLAGLDIGWAGRKRRAAANPDQDFSIVADRICEAGRFGQKTGAGWYRYEPGRRDPIPDPAVTRIIEQWRAERGHAARAIDVQEIVERCVFAMVNEGARILAEGIAQRASDIDVVYLNGYGFPKHRGGPMKYADEVGLPHVVRRLKAFATEPGADPALWTPAPLLLQLAAEGGSFN